MKKKLLIGVALQFILFNSSGKACFEKHSQLHNKIVKHLKTANSHPLNIISFQANYSVELQKAVVLTWEVNNSNDVTYIIERSTSKGFKEIGKVISANTLNPNNFYFTDFKPLDGKSYYRIKITRNKQKTIYTKVVSVKANLEIS